MVDEGEDESECVHATATVYTRVQRLSVCVGKREMFHRRQRLHRIAGILVESQFAHHELHIASLHDDLHFHLSEIPNDLQDSSVDHLLISTIEKHGVTERLCILEHMLASMRGVAVGRQDPHLEGVRQWDAQLRHTDLPTGVVLDAAPQSVGGWRYVAYTSSSIWTKKPFPFHSAGSSVRLRCGAPRCARTRGIPDQGTPRDTPVRTLPVAFHTRVIDTAGAARPSHGVPWRPQRRGTVTHRL